MLKTKMQSLRQATPDIEEEDIPDRLYISKNDKTGISINASIAKTCSQMTRACSVYCYGLGGRIRMPAALQRQAENSAFFDVGDDGEWGQLADEAVDITHVVARQQDFLRMFGVGDLQPGSVYFINQLSAYAKSAKPKFRIWVSTRNFALAKNLVDNTNLHVMLSFDATTLPKNRTAGLKLLAQRRPQFFAAWTRCSKDDVIPPWVSVVFEEHQVGRGRAKRSPEKRACPATIHESYEGAVDLNGACQKCTYCFDTKRRSTGSPLIQLKGHKR